MISSLQNEIAGWVSDELAKSPRCSVRDRKVIRDAVHGFILLEPYEVEILDCSLLQRLRYIHQTAFAYLVYPGANHTRFEHCLGVMHVANQMVHGLELYGRQKISAKIHREVRLAGLVHDVSHTFLSHVGESIIKEKFSSLFKTIKNATYKGQRRFFREAKEGEILAYLIITSEPFRRFLLDVCSHYSEVASEPYDPYRVAGLIIGHTDNTQERYLAEIINGPLDSDKLDYLLRDCYFSGIRGEVDAQRIIHTLGIVERTSGGVDYLHLTVKGAALTYLEQILIAKITLHTAIYHHHKIRALECLMKGAYEKINENIEEIKDRDFKFETIVDFFKMSEYQFLAFGQEEPTISPIIKRIINRNLPKRALVMCKPTVENWPDAISALSSNIPDQIELRKYRKQIFNQLPKPHDQWGIEILWIDNPPGPRIQEEASHCYIDLGSGKPETLSSLLPSDDWFRSYITNKLRAHVFYDNDESARKQVAAIACALFKEEFDIIVKQEAWTLAHL